MQACGITIMDSAIDVIPSVLRYLGKPPDSAEAADLAAVEKTLMAIRPYVRNFANSGAVDALGRMGLPAAVLDGLGPRHVDDRRGRAHRHRPARRLPLPPVPGESPAPP